MAALMSLKSEGEEGQEEEQDLDGLPLLDNRPIDFSGGAGLDGIPIGTVGSIFLCSVVVVTCVVHIQAEDIDGEPLPDPSLDGVPLSEDIDGVPSKFNLL